MNLKQILIITGLIILIIGGFYYTMSPYQNCIRDIDKRMSAAADDANARLDAAEKAMKAKNPQCS